MGIFDFFKSKDDDGGKNIVFLKNYTVKYGNKNSWATNWYDQLESQKKYFEDKLEDADSTVNLFYSIELRKVSIKLKGKLISATQYDLYENEWHEDEKFYDRGCDESYLVANKVIVDSQTIEEYDTFDKVPLEQTKSISYELLSIQNTEILERFTEFKYAEKYLNDIVYRIISKE